MFFATPSLKFTSLLRNQILEDAFIGLGFAYQRQILFRENRHETETKAQAHVE
jgi:hypothetical protein